MALQEHAFITPNVSVSTWFRATTGYIWSQFRLRRSERPQQLTKLATPAHVAALQLYCMQDPAMTLQPAPASHLRAACSAEYLRYAPHLVVLALGLFIKTLHCMLASPAITPQKMVLAAPQAGDACSTIVATQIVYPATSWPCVTIERG